MSSSLSSPKSIIFNISPKQMIYLSSNIIYQKTRIIKENKVPILEKLFARRINQRLVLFLALELRENIALPLHHASKQS